ncbi:MAG: NUDIX domain-containing protein [Candidatus Nanoarchaeia archaeon]|nr:NUDIX domain-containing protein [Candidatus Haiyanarchaeum thermophilum]MCW1302985.1 NUDIX domain-containing protein [Candidatus Haiyanarchaeum thermophilum]MCW1303663.1 NUDIX domain-containing protein [Candidatus Haiyanarchaeum thermophilum]MCW1306343.1 NUDIX domain-containing protein [Candidatus Haiyanarchaeum thermophilum]MCW1307147.1 NUDIX domain-containing protein [Candidatus Haiyanarchaeum thermophilum]
MGEVLVRVDKRDAVLGKVDRIKAHKEGILHRGFLIVVKNHENNFYLTQRNPKRIICHGIRAPFPSYWDCSVAGHPRWGQRGYVTQAMKEVEEELNMKISRKELKWLGKFYYEQSDEITKLVEHEICALFLLVVDNKISPNRTEISKAKWLTPRQLREFMKKNKITPWFLKACELFPEIFKLR